LGTNLQQATAGGLSGEGGGGGLSDEEDDLDALMNKLMRARPPPEVAKAAIKECKRLRQMGEC